MFDIFVLSICFLYFSVGVGAFAIGLSQISSSLSLFLCTLVQLINYILKCNYFGMTTVRIFENNISIPEEEFWFVPKWPSGAPLNTLSKLHSNPVGFVAPLSHMRQCIGLYAVAEVWRLLDIG